MKSRLVARLAVLLIACQVVVAELPAASRPAAADERRLVTYLLLDSRVVERRENARLTVGTVRKESANPLLVEDRPWEPRFDNLYANVLYDEEEHIYKCWYSPFIVDQAVSRIPPEKRKTLSYLDALHGNNREMGVCYAVSKDGLSWTRPSLGLVEFNGSKDNNIVLRRVHGAGIFKDARDSDPQRRYKLFGKTGDDREPVGVAFSADGIHWSRAIACPTVQAAGDTHNNAFWDARLSKYVAITRLWDGRQRVVGRSESQEFLQWSKAVDVLHGNPQRQSYAMPVFGHAGLYLGLLMILDTRTDLVDCELAWSSDGVRWERVCEGTPLIPRGPRGTFDYGCVYAAAYPIVREDEIRLYYGGSDDTHGSWRKGGLGLARLRPDGFAGYEPENRERAGVVLTRPIPYDGAPLLISTDAEGGSVRVEVLDQDGQFLASSRPVTGDVHKAVVQWEKGWPARRLESETVRFRFILRSARLYSFSFSKVAGETG